MGDENMAARQLDALVCNITMANQTYSHMISRWNDSCNTPGITL